MDNMSYSYYRQTYCRSTQRQIVLSAKQTLLHIDEQVAVRSDAGDVKVVQDGVRVPLDYTVGEQYLSVFGRQMISIAPCCQASFCSTINRC